MSFFAIFFAHRNVALGERRTNLELASDEAYDRKGITLHVVTHDRETPTLRGDLNILEEMSLDPKQHLVRVEAECETIEREAVWLLNQLRPFAESGQFEDFRRAIEFDIRDEDIVHLDLQQGSWVGGQTSLIIWIVDLSGLRTGKREGYAGGVLHRRGALSDAR